MKNNVKLWFYCSLLLLEYNSVRGQGGVELEDDDFDNYDDEIISPGCLPGWQSLENDYCYKYVDQPFTWFQAELACREYGSYGHLASLQNGDEAYLLLVMIEKGGHYLKHHDHAHSGNNILTAWVGLTKWCPNTGLKWSDGTVYNETLSPNMQAVQPDPVKCGALLFVNHGRYPLAPKNCAEQMGFACKLPKNDTKIEQNVAIGVEDVCQSYEWCYNDKTKRCYKVQQTKSTWQEAETACQNEGGNLVSIHSKSEEIYVTQDLVNGFLPSSSFWSGLNKLETPDDSLKWSDTTPIDFYPQFVVEFSKYQYSSCVIFALPRSPGYRQYFNQKPSAPSHTWALTRCDEKRFSICSKFSTNFTGQAENKDNSSDATDAYCTDGWIRYGVHTTRCYKAFGIIGAEKERANYFQAHRKCKENGANLVSISNVYENYFVLSLLNTTLNNSWIGLYLNASDQKIKWIDETAPSYSNFDTNTLEAHGLEQKETDKVVDKTPSILSSSKDRCFFMSIRQSPGIWMPVLSKGDIEKQLRGNGRTKRSKSPRSGTSNYNTNFIRLSSLDLEFLRASDFCDNQNLSFVCEKAVSSKKTRKAVDALECSESDSNETMRDVKSFKYDNLKPWLDAKKYCEKFNGSLVSIMNIFEFGFVASMAKMIKMDQFWIGLSETEDGQFKWSDDWPVLYTHWSTNEPQKRSSAQCVKMRLKDFVAADWSTEACANPAQFICKTTTDEKPAPDKIEGSCDKDWIEASTQCYKIAMEPLRATDATVECLKEYGPGAMLATFPTKDDLKRLINRQQIINSKKRFFIGLMQKVHGGYEWLTNHPVTFVNWAPGQPRYAWNPFQQICVEMDNSGQWYDAGCYELRYYICSKPKNSVTTTSAQNGSVTAVQSAPVNHNSSSVAPIVVTTSGPTVTTASSKSKSDSTAKPTVSDKLSTLSKSPLKQSSVAGSGAGVKVGIAFCVIFFMVLIGGIAAVLYRRKRAGQTIFGDVLGRGGNDQMRFEVLNETD